MVTHGTFWWGGLSGVWVGNRYLSGLGLIGWNWQWQTLSPIPSLPVLIIVNSILLSKALKSCQPAPVIILTWLSRQQDILKPRGTGKYHPEFWKCSCSKKFSWWNRGTGAEGAVVQIETSGWPVDCIKYITMSHFPCTKFTKFWIVDFLRQ